LHVRVWGLTPAGQTPGFPAAGRVGADRTVAAGGAVLAATGIAWTSVTMLLLGGCGWRDELTFVASAKNSS
jgi:hypothetical protein